MIPPLYKFRSIDEDNFESCRTLESLREGYVYFPNVTSLNDPFEMGAFLDQVSDPEAARREFMESDWSGTPLGDFLAPLSPRERATELAERWEHEEWRERYLNGLKTIDGFESEIKGRVCIYCASSTRSHNLLWSHYGAGHRGIAIELNANRDAVLANSLRVDYQGAFPTIDMLKDDTEEAFRKGLLTKGVDWQYEEEYRAIYPAESSGVRHVLNPSAFVSITFGARITDRAREMVIAATRARLQHVRFEQARLSKRTYVVEFEEYPVSDPVSVEPHHDTIQVRDNVAGDGIANLEALSGIPFEKRRPGVQIPLNNLPVNFVRAPTLRLLHNLAENPASNPVTAEALSPLTEAEELETDANEVRYHDHRD